MHASIRYAALAVTLAALAPMASAETARTSDVKDNGFSYRYVEAGYITQDFDGGFDWDGLGARIAWGIDEHLFIRAEAALFDGDLDYGFGSADVDGFLLGGGLGFHTPLKTGTDLVLTGDLLMIDYDVDFIGDDDDTGIRVTGGVRHRASDQLELSGGVFLENVDESEFGLFGQGMVKVADQLDVGASVRFGDDLTELALLARFRF